MKYLELIRQYCETHEIAIPPGFGRHPASRYAVIDLSKTPPQLVARTWFKQQDVIHFLRHAAGETAVRILDFKDGIELVDNGGSQLARGAEFLIGEP